MRSPSVWYTALGALAPCISNHVEESVSFMPPELTTRTRTIIDKPIEYALTEAYYYPSCTPPAVSIGGGYPKSLEYTPSGVKETVSSLSHKGPPFKEGGPFTVTRARIEHHPSGIFDTGELGAPGCDWERDRYRGSVFLGSFSPDPTIPLIITPSDLDSVFAQSSSFASNLESFGPTAYHRFSPLNPGAQLGQALVEGIHDGLPSLPLKAYRKLKNLRSLGSDYLNVEFGWKPLLSDLKNLYETQRTLNNRIAQIIRDNNRPVRRSGKIRSSRSSSITVLGSYDLGNATTRMSKTVIGSPSDDSWKRTKVTSISDDIWFVGRFRYYIPDVTDDRWSTKAKLALFGLNPTPSLLYEVMPWSWLIDWFSNVGDVIANLSSNGIADLITDYGFLMRTQRIETTYGATIAPTQYEAYPSTNGRCNVPSPGRTFTKLTCERKERIAATPFGFGLQIGDLSARQLAILTALGLSRLNF